MKNLRQKNELIINLTTEQKIADFEYLCDVLDKSYPFWGEVVVSGINKEAVYAEYRENIEKSRTDIVFFKEIGYFLKEFGGFGHLSVLDGYMYRLYTNTLTAGDGLLSEHELQKIQPLIKTLTNPISQNTYSLLDQSHTGFRSTVGLKDVYKNREMEETPKVSEAKIDSKILDDGMTAYLKLPSFKLTDYMSDKAVLERFFNEIKELPNLIIDIRGNSGGSDLYWKQLLVSPNVKETIQSERYFFFNMNQITRECVNANFLTDEIIDASGFKGIGVLSSYSGKLSNCIIERTEFKPSTQPYMGKIFVLVDEKVYSASENFVMFCKNSGFATLVGTNTNGDGGVADPLLVDLPNSGLLVRFSMFYGLNADGTGNEATGTTPDILLDSGEDALEKCISLLK
ncbi:MAG: S41 family peptidase [Velocimicrobium sp.]